jgi:putative metallopeptidase DUF4344
MRVWLLVVSMAFATLFASPAWSNSERIRIDYVPPENPAHAPVHKRLMEQRVLEQLQDLLSAFRLPKPLLLQLKGCKGVPNAWYENNTVTVCYEFVADIEARAPQTTTESGITRTDAIVGTIAQVFLHETGHALFDLLHVPIFGREEDAADQFAAYIILQMHREDARRLIDGVAHMLWNESTVRKVDRDAFSNIHGLPAQRFFNLVCMAYGAHTWYYADIVSKGLLPEERAESCKAEYRQVAYAMDTLISPHIDPDSRAKFKSTLKSFRVPELAK